MMLLQGAEWEEKYEATGELPDPTRVESDDEKAFYALLKREIPNHPGRFRRWSQKVIGVSEETTTGVMRLYQLETS